MAEATIICIPGSKYAGLTKEETAKSYTNTAIKEYDKLVSFEAEYNNIKEIPDHTIENFRQKEGQLIDLTIFADQPMIKVGRTVSNFTSSSYLLNPQDTELEQAGLYLPDLDIIEISGENQIQSAAKEIQKFYKKHGWQTTLIDTILKDKQAINSHEQRNNQLMEITNPDSLMALALEKTSYNPTKLYFDFN